VDSETSSKGDSSEEFGHVDLDDVTEEVDVA
jgi:hypothetical protein